MANFCCPIEMEPKTLKQGQLNLAREVAVDIVQNTESGEASNLFLEVCNHHVFILCSFRRMKIDPTIAGYFLGPAFEK
ncbi:hypothetical protein P3S68_005757 [Capsicum galapagoense]